MYRVTFALKHTPINKLKMMNVDPPQLQHEANERTLTWNAGRDYIRESRKWWWNRFYFWKWNLTVYYMKRRLFARTKVSLLLFSLLQYRERFFVFNEGEWGPGIRFAINNEKPWLVCKTCVHTRLIELYWRLSIVEIFQLNLALSVI